MNRIRQCSDHANERIKQRYGIEIDTVLANGILSKIYNRKAKFLRYMTESKRMVYKVRYDKKTYFVVVNKEIDKIITFLPNKQKEES